MNRAQFMEQLEKLLSDISEAERQEALDYYNSYFDDAGEEQENEVIRELGSPGKIAAIIKADLNESNDGYAEYTERGYEDTRTREDAQMPETRRQNREASGAEEDASGSWRRFGRDRAGQGSGRYERSRSRSERGYHADKKRNNAGIILVLILLIFISPLVKGAVGGILGVIVTIAMLPFLIVFALGAAVLGLVIGGIACGVTGIGLCFSNPAAGVLCIGIGCILAAVGLLLLALLVYVAGRLLPKLLRMFTDFCYRLLHRGRKDGANA